MMAIQFVPHTNHYVAAVPSSPVGYTIGCSLGMQGSKFVVQQESVGSGGHTEAGHIEWQVGVVGFVVEFVVVEWQVVVWEGVLEVAACVLAMGMGAAVVVAMEMATEMEEGVKGKQQKWEVGLFVEESDLPFVVLWSTPCRDTCRPHQCLAFPSLANPDTQRRIFHHCRKAKLLQTEKEFPLVEPPPSMLIR